MGDTPRRPSPRKTQSYSPEQLPQSRAPSEELYRYPNKSVLPPSPGPPEHSWGSGSYDDRGRCLETRGGKYGGASSRLGAGRNTTDSE